MKRPYLWLAIALVIAVNAVVLAGVARNRSGPPDASLILTERELVLDVSSRREENSGLSLQLDWRREFVREWFDEAKLAEVGFDIDDREETSSSRRAPELPAEAFVVLEYEGNAWNRHRRSREEKLTELRLMLEKGEMGEEQAQRERRQIEGDLASGSRLFAIDVGPGPKKLRARYPDGSRYLIAPALVRLHEGREKKRRILRGTVRSILVDHLHVPRGLAQPLLALPDEGRLHRGTIYYGEGKMPTPRYEVQVHWGQRYQPWVGGVKILGRKN